jgi:hypothetical protein
MTKEGPRILYSSSNLEPTRLQEERNAKEQLAEKHVSRSLEKELEGGQTWLAVSCVNVRYS